jgi:hypothetical protein
MKRVYSLFIILVLAVTICGCSQTSVDQGSEVMLTFNFLEENICLTLTADEAEKIVDILDGKKYNSFTSGIPSCGFDKDISLTADGRTYAIARDTCNCIQDWGNLRFFDIPKEDMAYIHSLFEKYGGYFPCI